MNRIENIILTIATAAALLTANTAYGNPTPGKPCPKTKEKNDRPSTQLSEDPRDGLLGEPRGKTKTGTRPVRDIDLERANAESGMRPEDGLPGMPRVKTKTGFRLPRDVNMERVNRGKQPYPTDSNPCPKDKNNSRTRTADNGRNQAANEAGSLLKHNGPVLPDLNGTRTRDNELNDRNRMMNKLKDAANKNKKNNANKNTTLGKTLERAGIDPSELEGADTQPYGPGTKITLDDGTVILTGPDKDGLGTSVTKPNGDQVEVYPDGSVTRTNSKIPGADIVTKKPNGTTIVFDGKKKTITITDKDGNTITRPEDFFKKINRTDMTYDDLMDLLFPDRTKGKKPTNTTLDDTLRRAGLTRKDLKRATKVEPSEFDKSVKITLDDGTEIWTGPDSDGSGSSVTKPNGDQTEVYPDGRVSTRKGQNGHIITTHPDGTTTDYDPKDDTMTVRDKNGNSETRRMEFWMDWFERGHSPRDLLDLYYDVPDAR